MAVRDFKQYLVKIQGQYLEMKNDLADFNQAFKDGHITEDQLNAAKEDVNILEQNYQRLLYAEYLLEIPNRKSKKAKHKKANTKLENAFIEMKADEDSVFEENKCALNHLRAELKKLTKK